MRYAAAALLLTIGPGSPTLRTSESGAREGSVSRIERGLGWSSGEEGQVNGLTRARSLPEASQWYLARKALRTRTMASCRTITVAGLSLLAFAAGACRNEDPAVNDSADTAARTEAPTIASLGCTPDCLSFDQAIEKMRETVASGMCMEYEVGHCGPFRFVRRTHSLATETQYFRGDGTLFAEHHDPYPDRPAAFRFWSGEAVDCERTTTEHLCGQRMRELILQLREQREAVAACNPKSRYAVDISVDASGRLASVGFQALDADSAPARCIQALLVPIQLGPGPSQRFRLPLGG